MDSLIVRITKNLKFSKKLKIPNNLQAYFLKTMSELLAQGFSMHQSLEFMPALLKKQKAEISYILSVLESGESFESSLRGLGFSNSIIAQIFYGQRQGRFIEAIDRSSKQLYQAQEYKNKLVKIIIYPLALFIGLVAMLFSIRAFLLPQITSFISQEVYERELLVRILVGFFTYLPQIFGIFLAVCFIIYGVVDLYLLKQSEFKRYQLLVKIPIFSHWVRNYATYIITRELGQFFLSGYSIQQVLQVLIDYPIDPFLTEIAKLIQEEMLKGIDLSVVLSDLAIFTEDLPLVIYQGELTSQSGQKCQIYSQKVYTDLMEDIQRKIRYVQPILFIFIALLVMAMYLMMMLPMLTMDGL
ncbi:competence type IV pilus assembly protein ComGB [Aerococcaceae bacterium WGS1372]